ncbi:MAG: carbohydrate ABC transporter permease [Candidatus Hydrogenedentes bacterium]|nr:carbohydrate ABC transporter permease [Candidatus Hydrogenedentota bacterium]
MTSSQTRRIIARLLTHAVLLACCAAALTPFAWMLSTSLKQSGHSLSRQVEWLPRKDVWMRDGQFTEVITLGARVRNLESGAVEEVGITSLAARSKNTDISLPEHRFPAEVLEWRVRPVGDAVVSGAVWVPFPEVRRRLAPHWRNYAEALEKMRFTALLKNTFAVTFLGTVGTLLSCSFVAYGFARFRFPGRDVLFVVLLSSMMLPPVVTMIPVYLIFRELRWIDTLLPLFMPAWFSTNAFAVFLFRQFFMTLPFDLDDAARIDGCGALRIYSNVLLPLCKPVLATVAMFSFSGFWLDFMSPLIYLNSILKFTLSLGLYMFKGPYDVQWDYLMAATLVVSLPCILIFLFGQQFFIRGVVMSGLKG